MKWLGILLAMGMLLSAVSMAAASDADSDQLAQATIDKALGYLKSKQKPDNGWQEQADPPGITALVLRAFISDDQYNVNQPFLAKGFEKLLSYQVSNGGIYNQILACYNTAIAISALAESKDPGYRGAMLKALGFLRSQQWSDKISGVPEDLRVKSDQDVRYGGFGYGRGARPDLSNTQMALDALHDAGVKPSDPAFQAAVKFATRCQNFSETNDQPWAGDDGGFIYTPANGGNSAAGEFLLGGRRMLRSYGSMTYAGLKSMIYAGLSHDDSRVKAAWDWISKNFTVDENPGMAALGPENAQGGLYYYFYTMARALTAYGQPVIVDPQGNRHDWRVALIQKLATLQRPDGSFVGQRRWMEDNPVLVTAYTVMVLEEAKMDLAQRPGR
ncbi:MAG TPA: prenyltransferase/squalene oxidase repeat-containing protein [Tepidisphaeraceae bacterium]|jgi:squalene-hopene/tetraprenyl-beta-curcumene cyclase|nr:prenyltransferase/squalene oxidase repeat-containing protein [Tepidisphaeraceae bacterium]